MIKGRLQRAAIDDRKHHTKDWLRSGDIRGSGMDA